MSAEVVASPGYESALIGAAVTKREDRGVVRVTGKDPLGMLGGVLTGRVPGMPSRDEEAVVRGQGGYSAVLTPKGRMVADLRVVSGPEPDRGVLLDVPAGALSGLLAHFGRFLPPRLARAVDQTSGTGALTVAGPEAAALLSREALGLRVGGEDLASLEENGWVWADTGGEGVLVVRSGELSTPAYDVLTDTPMSEALYPRLLEAGASPLDAADVETLRVEAGRPAWGAELDEDTLPPEAGIDARAIDHAKGCYTGQEVIVRIRDRGHVNRRLRGLRLGKVEAARGTEFWSEGREAAAGEITSVVDSPRAGGALALGYARREVEVPGEVRVGAPGGPRVPILSLEGRDGLEWWEG